MLFRKRPAASTSVLYRNYGLRVHQKRSRRPRFHLSWRQSALLAAAGLILVASGAAALSQHSARQVAVVPVSRHTTGHPKKVIPVVAPVVVPTPAPAPAPQPVQPANPASDCSDNTLSQLVVVSIVQRHMWACDGTTQVYNSPVITGMDFLAADLTPIGTYHVYAKYTDLHLKGSDSTGSWDDPVSYWMPWLHNLYGTYGFHDATWRADSDFGNISPDSPDASHGCVELPLATAAWLYGWGGIGLTLTIES